MRRSWRRLRRLAAWWMRALLHALGVRVTASGMIHAAPALFVANHVSWLDIPCLAACVPARFVAKREVARWPQLGALAAQTGTIFLTRGADAAAAAERMAAALERGQSVVLFPEGTSTDGRDVRRFHARLYRAAGRAGVAVQAVAIRYPHAGGIHPRVPFIGDDDFVRHLWRLLGEPCIDARLTFCAPLAAGNDRRALAGRTRDQIRSVLNGADASPPAPQHEMEHLPWTKPETPIGRAAPGA